MGQPYWTFKAPLPQPRLAPAMVVLGGNPLLTGGSYEVSLPDLLLLLLFCRRENYSSDSMSFQKGRGSDTCQDFCHQIHQCVSFNISGVTLTTSTTDFGNIRILKLPLFFITHQVHLSKRQGTATKI